MLGNIMLTDAASSGGFLGGGGVSTIIMIVVLIAIFYFLMIRPESKKKKAAEEMRSKMKVGDQITTIGGIVGTVCAVKEETFVIETGADRVRVEFKKWALSVNDTQTAERNAANQAAAGERKGLFGKKKKAEDGKTEK